MYSILSRVAIFILVLLQFIPTTSFAKSNLLEQILSQGEKGMVLHSEFPLKTPWWEIKKKWGAEDLDSTENYLNYKAQKSIYFQVNHLGDVITATNLDPQLNDLNIKDINKKLGRPIESRFIPNDQRQSVYRIGSHTITFIFNWSGKLTMYFIK